VREAQRAANEAAGTLAGSPPLGTEKKQAA
jgi:hypothetical protein